MEDISENTTASHENSENEKGKKPKRGTHKRQVHNEVERRRKDKINSWIMKISELLPNKELLKKSKISILEQTVTFIKGLLNERDKLLSSQCSEIQLQEIKSLRQSLKLLEEQNAAYAKLLQQANISLNSLPKKSQKYSDKFTKETGTMLAAKHNMQPNVGEHMAAVHRNSSDTREVTPILPNIAKTAVVTQAIVTLSTDPVVVQNEPVCTLNTIVTTNVPQLLTNSLVLSGSISRLPGLQSSATDVISTGGVTSALPSIPVMSSTLGSSFSTIYSKSMQVILLPTGASLIQPSIVPSNISVINPSLESILPVVVPHTVPIPTISLVSENAATLTSSPSNVPGLVPPPLDSSLASTEATSTPAISQTSDSTSSMASTSHSVPSAPVSAALVGSVISEKSEEPSSLPTENEPDDECHEDSVLPMESISQSPGSGASSTNPDEPSGEVSNNNSVSKTNCDVPEIVPVEEEATGAVLRNKVPIAEKTTETVNISPPSLQALSANKLMSLANKFQVPSDNGTVSLNQEASSGEKQLVLCVDNGSSSKTLCKTSDANISICEPSTTSTDSPLKSAEVSSPLSPDKQISTCSSSEVVFTCTQSSLTVASMVISPSVSNSCIETSINETQSTNSPQHIVAVTSVDSQPDVVLVNAKCYPETSTNISEDITDACGAQGILTTSKTMHIDDGKTFEGITDISTKVRPENSFPLSLSKNDESQNKSPAAIPTSNDLPACVLQCNKPLNKDNLCPSITLTNSVPYIPPSNKPQNKDPSSPIMTNDVLPSFIPQSNKNPLSPSTLNSAPYIPQSNKPKNKDPSSPVPSNNVSYSSQSNKSQKKLPSSPNALHGIIPSYIPQSNKSLTKEHSSPITVNSMILSSPFISQSSKSQNKDPSSPITSANNIASTCISQSKNTVRAPKASLVETTCTGTLMQTSHSNAVPEFLTPATQNLVNVLPRNDGQPAIIFTSPSITCNNHESSTVQTSTFGFSNHLIEPIITSQSMQNSNSIYNNKVADAPFNSKSNTLSYNPHISTFVTTANVCPETALPGSDKVVFQPMIPWQDNLNKLVDSSKYLAKPIQNQCVPESCYLSSIQQSVSNNLMQETATKPGTKPKMTTPSGAKIKSKLPKKSKSAQGINPGSQTGLLDVVPSVNNYFDYTFDILNPVSDALGRKPVVANKTGPKSSNVTSSSDILAKAAESIFGHDSFHSIEDAHETNQELSSIHLEATASFSNADIFSQTFVLSQPPSKLPVECETPKPSSENPHLSKQTSENLSNRNRKTQYQGICDSEPKPKKAKDNFCPTLLQNVHQGKVPSSHTNTSSAAIAGLNCSHAMDTQSMITTTTSTETPTLYSTSASISTSLSQQQTDHSLVSRNAPSMMNKSQSMILEDRQESRRNSSLSMSNSANLDFSQTYLAPFNPITHPVNNLFDNSSTTVSKTNLLSSQSSISQGSKKGQQNDMVLAKTSTVSNGAEAIQHKLSSTQCQIPVTNISNSTLNFLPHPNSLLFPGMHDMNPQPTQSSTISFDMFNAHTHPPIYTTSQDKNSPMIHQQAPLPPLLSRDPSSGVSMHFNSNVRMASVETNSKSVNSITNPDMLSHSLCSLLKETSPPRHHTTNGSVSAPMSSANSNVQSNVSKSNYSALSLISHQTYVSSKTTKANDLISFSTSTSSPANSHAAACAVSQSSLCSRSSKTSLSYSAERLIQNQFTRQKDRSSSNIPNFLSSSKKADVSSTSLVQEPYKSSNFTSVSSSELTSQTLPSLPLPPVTSFPSFPSGFSVCDIRPPTTSIHHNTVSQYQDVPPPSLPKDNLFPHSTNFNMIPQVQPPSTRTPQTVGLPKTHSNLALSVESSGNIYNSCNFLQHPKSNLDIMKTSDGSSCFQSIFVNGSYAQQAPKQNYCHFMDQPVSETPEMSEKSFPILPPMTPFHGDKLVGHPLPISVSQSNTSYTGNIFYEPASCSHKAIESNNNKSSSSALKTSQEIFVPPVRSKQSNGLSQNLGTTGQTKSSPSSKAKAKKLKQSNVNLETSSRVTNPFNSTGMNFNMFPVPDLPPNKSSHGPKTFAKAPSQPLVPGIGDLTNQQNKMADAMLGPVIPVSGAFNPGLPQQNDGFLNLNFQPPNYSDSPLAIHPPLTPCPSTPKSSRSFTSAAHPVPNFNLSNILPDMGCPPSNELNHLSPMKFLSAPTVPQSHHQDCQPNSSSSVLAPPRQPLYPAPHPSVVPNALPPLIANHGGHSLGQNQPPSLSVSNAIHQPPHFTNTNPPFRNVIHSLNLARTER